MIRRNDGRRMGRTGPVIGLPASGERLSSYGATGSRAQSYTPSIQSPGAASQSFSAAAMGYELRAGQRSTFYDDREDLDAEIGRSEGASRFAEQLGIARLFGIRAAGSRDHEDAYEPEEDAQSLRVVHKAGSHRETSAIQAGVLFLGGLTASTLLFSAGFLAAVLVFGEPGQGDSIAIRTGGQGDVAPIGDAGSAIAIRPPAPDISNVEARSEAAFGAPTAEQSAETSPSDATQSVVAAVSPAMSSVTSSGTASATSAEIQSNDGAIGPSVAASQPAGSGFTTLSNDVPAVPVPTLSPVFFPEGKPQLPVRDTSAATQASSIDQVPAPQRISLGPPGGEYSLQFGAFRDRANAEGLLRELAPSIQAQVIATVGAGGIPLYYVRGGSFQSRIEAVTAVRDLRRILGVVTFVYANQVSG